MINADDFAFDFGDLYIDTLKASAYRNGKDLYLSRNEYIVLMELILNYPGVVDREYLYRAITPNEEMPMNSRMVDVYICRIRIKLRQSRSKVTIETVRQKGYQISVKENHAS